MTDWKTLQHAEGAASKVPTQIAALTKGGNKGAVAHDELDAVLWRSGTWYDAGAEAIPLLVRAAEAGAVAALHLVGEILAGGMSRLLDGRHSPSNTRDPLEVAAIARANESGDRIRALLGSSNDAMRAAAAFVLAGLPDVPADDELTEVAATNAYSSASASIALAVRSGHRAPALARARAADSIWRCFGGALGELILGAGEDDAYRALVLAMGRLAEDLKPMRETFPWGRGVPERAVVLASRRFEEGARSALLDAWVAPLNSRLDLSLRQRRLWPKYVLESAGLAVDWNRSGRPNRSLRIAFLRFSHPKSSCSP